VSAATLLAAALILRAAAVAVAAGAADILLGCCYIMVDSVMPATQNGASFYGVFLNRACG
jgi:hypothetical protein